MNVGWYDVMTAFAGACPFGVHTMPPSLSLALADGAGAKAAVVAAAAACCSSWSKWSVV